MFQRIYCMRTTRALKPSSYLSLLMTCPLWILKRENKKQTEKHTLSDMKFSCTHTHTYLDSQICSRCSAMREHWGGKEGEAKDGGRTWKWHGRCRRKKEKKSQIDDVKRELSRLSPSMLILENVRRVNLRFPSLFSPPSQWAAASAGCVKTGVHSAPDSTDNFQKLLRISVSACATPPLIRVTRNFAALSPRFPKKRN